MAALSCVMLWTNAVHVHGQTRPLTVLDAIEMTTLTDPNPALAAMGYASGKVNFSPARDQFVVVTRTPDLQSGTNRFKILLYRLDEVHDAFIGSSCGDQTAQLPEPVILAEFVSQTNGSFSSESGVRSIKWSPSGHSIVYIAERGASPSQVFETEISTSQTWQVSFSDRSVVRFDYHFDSKTLLYFTSVPTYPQAHDASVRVLGVENMGAAVVAHEPVYGVDHQLFLKKKGNSDVVAIGHPFFTYQRVDSIWMSPNGRWAIVEQFVDTVPASWEAKYPSFVPNEEERSIRFDENTMVKCCSSYSQLAVVDIVNGSVTRFLDAPTGRNVAGVVDIAWRHDGNSAIIGSIFPPAQERDVDESNNSPGYPAIVEYDFITSDTTSVVELNSLRSKEDARHIATNSSLKSLELRIDGVLIIQFHVPEPLSSNGTEYRYFLKDKGNWSEVKEVSPSDQNLVEISVEQDLTLAPEIVAVHGLTGCRRAITNLNPQFDGLSFGKVEEISWTDSSGLDWRAGLVYPVGYDPSERYPLVVQTNGYFPNTFLIEGPVHAAGAYSAQALANRGMMVVQLSNQFYGMGTPTELSNHRRGLESVIDLLDSQSRIDRSRVGLMGFSRTGMHIQNAITSSEYAFAAATVSDASNISMFLYAGMFGTQPPGMSFVEELLGGAVPWGQRLRDWTDRNLVFQTDRIKTPLRLEAYTTMIHWWDVYAILKRQAKPVEWVAVAPDAMGTRVHNLVLPDQRFVIQQGNVDWFDFWLNDRERTEPYPGSPESQESLEAQYARWRNLKALQPASETAAIKARKWHREELVRRKAADAWLETEAGKRAVASSLGD